MRPFGGRSPEFGANHVYLCSLFVPKCLFSLFVYLFSILFCSMVNWLNFLENMITNVFVIRNVFLPTQLDCF